VSYALLNVARQNVGDHLYHRRITELLEKYRQEEELVDLGDHDVDYNQPLDDYLDIINSTKALIVCGGPLYFKDIYPQYLPITSNFDLLKVPIIPFGLGLNGQYGTGDTFTFTPQSSLFLRYIHDHCEYSSNRDVITDAVLRRNGITNTLMTGDPAWYHLDSLDKNMPSQGQYSEPDRIIFSSGAHLHEGPVLSHHKDLLTRMRERFPNAEILHCIHRGIIGNTTTKVFARKVKYTAKHWLANSSYPQSLMRNNKYEKNLLKFNRYASSIGIDSYYHHNDFESLLLYDDYDMHVGFRLHAHLYFTSILKPSFLIAEDIRAQGYLHTVSEEPVLSYNDPNLTSELLSRVSTEINTQFINKIKEINTVRDNIKNMKTFLESLP